MFDCIHTGIQSQRREWLEQIQTSSITMWLSFYVLVKYTFHKKMVPILSLLWILWCSRPILKTFWVYKALRQSKVSQLQNSWLLGIDEQCLGSDTLNVYSKCNAFHYPSLQMLNSQLHLQLWRRSPLNSRTGAQTWTRTSQDPPRLKMSWSSKRKNCGSMGTRRNLQQRTVMMGTPWRKNSSKQYSS